MGGISETGIARPIVLDENAVRHVQCSLRTAYVTQIACRSSGVQWKASPAQFASQDDAGIPSTEPYPMRWLVAAVVLAANVMDLLDATIINVAAPSIHRDLGGGATTIQWLSAGYTLAFAVLLIAAARLGDILGRRRLFLVGSAGFTLFSAACAMAPSIGVLIVLRALQGAFGALDDPPRLRPHEAGLHRRSRNGQSHESVRSGNGRANARGTDTCRRSHRRQPLGHRVASGVPHQRSDRPADTAARLPFTSTRRHSPERKTRHRWRLAYRTGLGCDHLPLDPGPD